MEKHVTKTKQRSYSYLKEILSNIFKKKVTLKYPKEFVEIPDQFRGVPVLVKIDDCIACGKCSRECPTHCINISELEENSGNFEIIFNLGQCMFCGTCAEGCSRSAIEMTNIWKLSSTNKSDFIKTYCVSRIRKKEKTI